MVSQGRLIAFKINRTLCAVVRASPIETNPPLAMRSTCFQNDHNASPAARGMEEISIPPVNLQRETAVWIKKMASPLSLIAGLTRNALASIWHAFRSCRGELSKLDGTTTKRPSGAALSRQEPHHASPSTRRSSISEYGFWQILSRSGHVVYESAEGDYVRAVCRELCALGVRNVVVEAGPTDHDRCYV